MDNVQARSAPTWAAYVCTEQGAEVAHAVLSGMGFEEGALRGGGLSGAARLSEGPPIAEVLLTEIGNTPVETACDYVAEIRRSGARVVALGQQSDLSTYRALRRAGAWEYFAFPVTPGEIAALRAEPPVAANTAVPAAAPCPTLGVLGVSGGSGASMLARNLAFHAASARGPGLRTALIDADLQFGTQALDLDCPETPGLLEALSAPDRIDATFLSATMGTLAEGLTLYSHQPGASRDIATMEAALPRIIGPLREAHEALVLDLPRGATLRHPALAAELDALILVVPAGYAGVNAATRLIQRLRAEAPGLRLLPVLSDLRRDAGLHPRDLSRAIGEDFVSHLPRCDAAATRALRNARALVDCQPRGAYARAVRDLFTLGAAPEKPRRAPRGLFRRKAA